MTIDFLDARCISHDLLSDSLFRTCSVEDVKNEKCPSFKKASCDQIQIIYQRLLYRHAFPPDIKHASHNSSMTKASISVFGQHSWECQVRICTSHKIPAKQQLKERNNSHTVAPTRINVGTLMSGDLALLVAIWTMFWMASLMTWREAEAMMAERMMIATGSNRVRPWKQNKRKNGMISEMPSHSMLLPLSKD